MYTSGEERSSCKPATVQEAHVGMMYMPVSMCEHNGIQSWGKLKCVDMLNIFNYKQSRHQTSMSSRTYALFFLPLKSNGLGLYHDNWFLSKKMYVIKSCNIMQTYMSARLVIQSESELERN